MCIRFISVELFPLDVTIIASEILLLSRRLNIGWICCCCFFAVYFVCCFYFFFKFIFFYYFLFLVLHLWGPKLKVIFIYWTELVRNPLDSSAASFIDGSVDILSHWAEPLPCLWTVIKQLPQWLSTVKWKEIF